MSPQTRRPVAAARSFRRHPIAAAVSTALLGLAPPLAAQVLPVNPQVVSGSAGFSTDAGKLQVTNTPNAIINWQAFSIGAQNAVRFEQQSASSQVLNRVVGNDLSSILGTLSSNGRVWLVNPNGVVFGQGARIDVAGLVASTLAISNESFLSGKYAFQSTGTRAGVLNQGDITASAGGRVWLVGETVGNEGAIKAEGGSIILAAGKSVEMVDSSAPNVRVKLTAPADSVLNVGSLIAQGGSVDLHGGMVNQQGIVRADSLAADAAGRITLSASGGIVAGAGSETSASAVQGSGGTVTLDSAQGTTSVSGKVLATSSGGRGGKVAVLGERVQLADGAQVDASGARGGGQVLVGGDYQGKNAEVHNARQTLVAPGAQVAANATVQGDGGRIIIWGNDTAQVYGAIAAHGAGQGGNGGFLETSGGRIDVRPQSIDLGAGEGGKAGAWLLDPFNIRIANVDDNSPSPEQTVPAGCSVGEVVVCTTFTSTADDSVISPGVIEGQLNDGVSVTVATGAGGTQAGDISVQANITASDPNPGSLTLSAHRNIVMNRTSITSTGGPMGVTLAADSDGDGNGVVVLIDARILSAGGDVALSGGGRGSAGSGVGMLRGLIDAGAGRVTLTGRDFADPVFNPVLNNIEVSPGVFLASSSVLAGDIGVGGGAVRIDGRGTDAAGQPAPSLGSRTSMTIAADGSLGIVNGAVLSGGPGSITLTGREFQVPGSPLLSGTTLSNSQVQAGAVSVGGDSVRLQDGSLVANTGDVAVTVGHGILVDVATPTAATTNFIRSDQGNVRLEASGPAAFISASNLSVDAARNVTVSSDGTFTALPGTQLIGRGPGTAVALAAATLDNQAGPALISTPAGRWLVYQPQPQQQTGLPIQFEAFGVPRLAEPTAAPANQNGVAYATNLAFDLLLPGKVYDGTTTLQIRDPVSVAGGLAGYTVTSTPGANDTGNFLDKDVGAGKPVVYAGNRFAAQGPAGVPVFGNTFTFRSDITAATLTFVADPAVRFQGGDLGGLSGQVTGFVAADTLATETTGSAVWTTTATPQSPAGNFPIDGSGLSARNYVFQQSPSNATALTLSPANTAGETPRTLEDASTQALFSAMQTALATISVPTGGSVLDVTGGKALFGPLAISKLSEEELSRILENRRQFKRKLFADAIYRLELDPALAEVPLCPTPADAASGECRYSPEQVAELQKARAATPAAAAPAGADAPARKQGALPQINRKVAVLFGVSDYQDKKIPPLETSVPDVDSVSKVVAERMGYEVRVVKNPTKADIVSTLNKLANELGPEDSLLIYYSGHGYTLQRNGAGYWLAADAPVDDPKRWISNEDVSRMLAAIPSRQLALVTDSCYSSAFTREGTGALARNATPEEVLTKRSVVVLASGGDEPVSDEAKEGHSVFAWNLMNTLKSVENWRPGSNVFSEIQTGVRKELPQTPRFSSVTAAGHQVGGDYLFEQR